jgi:carboxypeptidase C (cathepsin A)
MFSGKWPSNPFERKCALTPSRVEQPVGTGFSIGEITATNEEDIAEDFVNFFLNFENIFGIKNFKIYVTGESYAGRYVPYIAGAMIDKANTTHFDLSGKYLSSAEEFTLIFYRSSHL